MNARTATVADSELKGSTSRLIPATVAVIFDMGTLDIIVEANATSLRCWQRASSSSIQEDWLNVIATAKAVMV